MERKGTKAKLTKNCSGSKYVVKRLIDVLLPSSTFKNFKTRYMQSRAEGISINYPMTPTEYTGNQTANAGVPDRRRPKS